MAYAILLPLLVDSGWSLMKISLVVNVYGLLIGIVSSMASGWLIQRMGRRKVLVGIAGALGIGILLLLLPASGYHDFFSGSVAIGVLFILYGPAMTVMSTLMMDQSSPHAPATEFAMQHSLFHLMSHISNVFGLAAAGWAGYPAVIIAASIISFITLGVAIKGYPQIEMTACVSPA
jgi:MFS family permease